ncbi:SDR family NAD(P)-dependent oxidoreductase [Nonomuraea basaltis]|uniref:SDR family NAD(P)-dependent oxidoreductase n=1 Tax=Nonomuraea basaltis TaxID=2495887 RepID=UPI001F0F18C0|nr:SDR family NAD(P)-dependent oxidoreductase [Nonomuraea basaltis]
MSHRCGEPSRRLTGRTQDISDIKGTAVVTGASTGLGAVYADRLARRGYDVLLVARNKARLDALAAQVAASTGRNAEVLRRPCGLRAARERGRAAAHRRVDHAVGQQRGRLAVRPAHWPSPRRCCRR